MIERLYDKFIKGAPDGAEERDRYASAVFEAAILAHFFMFALKLAAGILIRSVAVRTDAWNNFAAMLTALFGLLTYRNRETDGLTGLGEAEDGRKKGIRKARYIAAFIAAFFVFEIGFSLFSRAFTRLQHPTSVSHAIPAVFVLAGCIFIRRALAVFCVRSSGKLDISLLPGSVRNARAANIRTALAAAAILLDQYVHINADFLATLFLSISVMKEGIMIAVEVIRPAVEEVPDRALVRAVKDRLREYGIVQGIGSVKIRFFGPGRRMIAMRIKVPKAADMAEIFGNVRVIEETVGKEFGVTLILHTDLIESSDRESLLARHTLEEALDAMDERLSFDHFHIVHGKDFSNVIFDLFVPYEYGEEKIRAITERIDATMRELDLRYICIISPRKLT